MVNGEYRFNISPNFERKLFNELDIGCRDVDFTTTQSFDLAISTDGGGAATWFIGNELRNISTNLNYNGMCQITYFNKTINIVAGTFAFKIFDEVTQTVYTITEGRFDAKFTQ